MKVLRAKVRRQKMGKLYCVGSDLDGEWKERKDDD